VPALLDGEELVFESSAIALYLTDKYRVQVLGPSAGEPTRGAYLSWLAYRPGVMEPALLARRFGIKHVFGAMGWAPADEVEAVLNRHLSDRPYFLGDVFSADGRLGSGNRGVRGLYRPYYGPRGISVDNAAQQTPIARICGRAAIA
jgi:glutathione S-transferase